jgi:hypothetical protein
MTGSASKESDAARLADWAEAELGWAPSPARAAELAGLVASLRAALDAARPRRAFDAEPGGFLRALERWKAPR